MDRRKFLKSALISSVAFPLTYKVLAQENTVETIDSTSAEPVSASLEEFTLAGIDYNQIDQIFDLLKMQDIENGFLYIEDIHYLSFDVKDAKLINLECDHSQGYRLDFLKENHLFSFRDVFYDEKELMRSVKSYMNIKNTLVTPKAKPKKTALDIEQDSEQDSLSQTDENDTTETTNKIEKQAKYEKLEPMQSGHVGVFANEIGLEKKKKFVLKFMRDQKNIVNQADDFFCRWIEFVKEKSIWDLEANAYSLSKEQCACLETEIIADGDSYFIQFGNFKNPEENIFDLENQKLAEPFYELTEKIDEDMKIPRGETKPEIIPVMILPGKPAVLWSQCLYPFFDISLYQEGEALSSKVKKMSEFFTLTDEPLYRDSSLFMSFDDDGYVCKTLPLVQNGEPNKQLITRFDSWKGKTGETGRVRRNNIFSQTKQAPVNLYVENGTDKPDDLMNVYKKLVLIEQFGEILLDQSTGNFTALVKKGYLMENGKKKLRLKNFVLSDNIFELALKIKGVGDDLIIDKYPLSYYNNKNILYTVGMPSVLITDSFISTLES